MDELCLHILDIVENSISAGAKNIEIYIFEDEENDKIIISVKDDGRGMDKEEIKLALNPFYSTKGERKIGLGLPILLQVATQCEGRLTIKSEKGRGTEVLFEARKSHIDLPPLGNIEGTILSLIPVANEVNIKFTYKKGNKVFILDTKKLKNELDGISLTHPEVLRFIKTYIKEALSPLKQKSQGGRDYAKSEGVKNS